MKTRLQPLSLALLLACDAPPEPKAPQVEAPTSPAAKKAAPRPYVRPLSACEMESRRLDADLSSARHCADDADCQRYSLGCPFGCASHYNAKVMLSLGIKERVAAYQQNCDRCDYRCLRSPSGRVACVKETCQFVAEQSE